jgi:hypothetical protein
MLRNFPVYFQCFSFAPGDSMQHNCDMVEAKTLEEMRLNFEIDRGREDPKAKRRPTRKQVRHELIKRAFDAYMTPHPRVPEFRRNTTEAVRQIKEGWKDRFDVDLDESTIYRALNLRRPAKK